MRRKNKFPSNRHAGSSNSGSSKDDRSPRKDRMAPSGNKKGLLVGMGDLRVVVGNHAMREVIHVHPKKIQKIWVNQDYESNPELRAIIEEAIQKKISIETHPRGFLDNQVPGHQGAILLTSFRPSVDWDRIQSQDVSTLVFLDGIEDPHNLGAILRTSWLTGVSALTIPSDRAVGLTPSVHKVACGGVEHVPVEQTNNFGQIVDGLKENGYWVFGLSHKSNKTIFDLKIPEKVVWMIGSEDKGLRTNSERICDELVSLPQVSASASYNASVAAALALMETVRQRKFQSK